MENWGSRFAIKCAMRIYGLVYVRGMTANHWMIFQLHVLEDQLRKNSG